MKCEKCEHRGGLVVNPEDMEGSLIRLCLHHQVEMFGEYMKKHYRIE